MIDRRDFDEWLARELARNPSAALSPTERDWAQRAFMAAGVLMSQAARTQRLLERMDTSRKAVPSLLKGANHVR